MFIIVVSSAPHGAGLFMGIPFHGLRFAPLVGPFGADSFPQVGHGYSLDHLDTALRGHMATGRLRWQVLNFLGSL